MANAGNRWAVVKRLSWLRALAAPQIQIIPIFLRSSPHLPVMCDRADSRPPFHRSNRASPHDPAIAGNRWGASVHQ